MKYKVVKILKKQILAELDSEMTLEEVKELVIKTYGESENIIIYGVEQKDGEADV